MVAKLKEKLQEEAVQAKALMAIATFVTSTDTRLQIAGHSKDHPNQMEVRQKTEKKAKLKMEENQRVVQGRKAKTIKANMCRHSKQMVQNEPNWQKEMAGMKEPGGKKEDGTNVRQK